VFVVEHHERERRSAGLDLFERGADPLRASSMARELSSRYLGERSLRGRSPLGTALRIAASVQL